MCCGLSCRHSGSGWADSRKDFTAVETFVILNCHKIEYLGGSFLFGYGEPTCAKSSLAQSQEWFDVSLNYRADQGTLPSVL